jgi:hypothetical protein
MDEVMLKSGMGYGIPLAAKILASIDFNPLDTKELPSREEYESKFSKPSNPSYSEPKFKCPECDGGMCKDHKRQSLARSLGQYGQAQSLRGCKNGR